MTGFKVNAKNKKTCNLLKYSSELVFTIIFKNILSIQSRKCSKILNVWGGLAFLQLPALSLLFSKQ